MGARSAIPPLRHEAPVACPGWNYNNRKWGRTPWAKLMEWRAVATQYEKTIASFLGDLCLDAAIPLIEHKQAQKCYEA